MAKPEIVQKGNLYTGSFIVEENQSIIGFSIKAGIIKDNNGNINMNINTTENPIKNDLDILRKKANSPRQISFND